jgi:hypothetical protein
MEGDSGLSAGRRISHDTAISAHSHFYEAPREPQHRTLQVEPGKYTLRGVPVRLARKKTVVLRNKTQVIREAGLLIKVLEEALHYRPEPLSNSPAPA